MWGTAQLCLSDRGTQSSSSWEWWRPVASGIALCWRDCLVQAYTSSSRAAHVQWEVHAGIQRPGPFLSYLKSLQGDLSSRAPYVTIWGLCFSPTLVQFLPLPIHLPLPLSDVFLRENCNKSPIHMRSIFQCVSQGTWPMTISKCEGTHLCLVWYFYAQVKNKYPQSLAFLITIINQL